MEYLIESFRDFVNEAKSYKLSSSFKRNKIKEFLNTDLIKGIDSFMNSKDFKRKGEFESFYDIYERYVCDYIGEINGDKCQLQVMLTYPGDGGLHLYIKEATINNKTIRLEYKGSKYFEFISSHSMKCSKKTFAKIQSELLKEFSGSKLDKNFDKIEELVS